MSDPLQEAKLKEAVWAASLHDRTNTILTDAAIKDICRALPQIYEALKSNALHTPGLKCPVCIALGSFTVTALGILTNCEGYKPE